MQIQTLAHRSLVRARHLRSRHLDFERRPETAAELLAAVLMLSFFMAAAILI